VNVRRCSGHTLIEMLVVIMVLMIIAAIVVPSTSVGDERKLDTLQLAIQDALDHAQSLAYHQGAPFGVRFSVAGQWFAAVDENGVPIDDPLSHGDYVIRLSGPDMPSNIHIDAAEFGIRPLACFDGKGVLMYGGEVHLRAGNTQRWLSCDTATSKLTEIPVEP
jgi:type II secretory pathway pseudopilin PulG